MKIGLYSLPLSNRETPLPSAAPDGPPKGTHHVKMTTPGRIWTTTLQMKYLQRQPKEEW